MPRTHKNRKSLRRSKRRAARARGGGWSDGPDSVSPGYLVHHQYTGPGKDCTGNAQSLRPGYIGSYTAKGLPGLSGGGKRRKNRGGGGMPFPASTSFGAGVGPVPNPNLPPVNGSLTPKPDYFPDTTGAGGTVGQPNVVMSMPGVPTPGAAQMPPIQKGGRYGFFPEMGPLNPDNGVGVAPAPFGRIPCESGTFNPLNPNPGNVQGLTTAPLTPPYVSGKLSGGGNFPTVQVGQVDAMRYYAPTAGYRNDFMTFRAPSPVPGLTIQTPYDAKAFNQACIKTGGARKNKKNKGGASMPVAFDAGKISPLVMSEITTRKDFDGSGGLLPVKFGGKRRTRRVLKNKRKSRKNHN